MLKVSEHIGVVGMRVPPTCGCGQQGGVGQVRKFAEGVHKADGYKLH